MTILKDTFLTEQISSTIQLLILLLTETLPISLGLNRYIQPKETEWSSSSKVFYYEGLLKCILFEDSVVSLYDKGVPWNMADLELVTVSYSFKMLECSNIGYIPILVLLREHFSFIFIFEPSVAFKGTHPYQKDHSYQS